MKKVTYDDTRDCAIRIIEKLNALGILPDSIFYEDKHARRAAIQVTMSTPLREASRRLTMLRQGQGGADDNDNGKRRKRAADNGVAE